HAISTRSSAARPYASRRASIASSRSLGRRKSPHLTQRAGHTVARGVFPKRYTAKSGCGTSPRGWRVPVPRILRPSGRRITPVSVFHCPIGARLHLRFTDRVNRRQAETSVREFLRRTAVFLSWEAGHPQ